MRASPFQVVLPLASHNCFLSYCTGYNKSLWPRSTSRHKENGLLCHLFPLSPPLMVESHSSLVPTAAHDIWVRGYLQKGGAPIPTESLLSVLGVAAPSGYEGGHLSVGSRLYLKQAFPLLGLPTPVQSLRAYHGRRGVGGREEMSFQRPLTLAVGSNPADCPILCHYFPLQAFCSCHTAPFGQQCLATQRL